MFYFTLVPIFDSRSDALWQATGQDLLRDSVIRNIDTETSTTQHYVFFTGQDDEGALGIAWLGTACLQSPYGK